MIARHIRLQLTAIAVLAVTAPLAAQKVSADTSVLPPVAGISIQGGQMGLGSTAFNQQLALQGRGLLKKNTITLGVESWVRWNRVMQIGRAHV